MVSLYNYTIKEEKTPASFSLILTVVWLINKKFALATRSPVQIGQYAETKEAEMEHNDLIEEVLKRASQIANIRFLIEASNSYGNIHEYYDFGESLDDEEYFYYMDGETDKAIFFIDGYQSFGELVVDLTTEREYYDRNGFFCIVYTGREENRLEHIHRIFHHLFDIYVINVNVLLFDGETTHAYTYFPFKPNQCHNGRPHLVGSLGPSTHFKFTAEKFFHKKLSNMWGCNLMITTWHEPPFMLIENNKLKGIEGYMLMDLSERMNFTIVLNAPPGGDRGIVFPNKTGTGPMKMLIDGETNITIICLMYDNNRLRIAEAAYTYFSASLMLALPMGHHMAPLERLLRPFRKTSWILLSLSIFCGILVIFVSKYYSKASSIQTFIFGHKNRTPFTNLWRIFYGVPLHCKLPRRNFARYLLALWIVYTWILRTAYMGQLFYILQDTRARLNLKSLDDVISNNYTFFTFPLLVPLLFDDSNRPPIVKYIDSGEHSLKNMFHRLGREESKIVVTAIGHIIQYYNQLPENRQYQVETLSDPIVMAPLTFYMPRHSYLRHEINELLLQIMSAGLMDHYVEISLDDRVWSINGSKEPILLSLRQILGIFTVYSVLLVLCFLVFLLELFSTRILRLRKIIEVFDC